jgi:SM-20-related protein
LHEDERSHLLDYVLSRESEFVPTTTSTGETDYRRSQILYWFPDYSDWMVQRVAALLPEVFQRLGMAQVAIKQIEIQLTAHNDGHYYKIHNDNGSTEAATRVLSYVYYFHRHPKAFTGGELQMYDPEVEYGAATQTDGFQLIEPRNNRIVFFPSGYLHAVKPVVCPSQAFADSRFTLNGWVRQV